MKWHQKGHELDKIAEKILVETKFSGKVYIYGAKDKGGKLYPVLKAFDCFSGFIDQDRQRQAEGYLGEQCISFEKYAAHRNSGIIVICASNKNEKEISSLLESKQLLHQVDYFFYEEFVRYYFPIIALYYYGQLFLPLAQIVLTERCTLRCEKCAHACASVKNAKDIKLADAVQTIECFFEKADYIQEFVLIGGEPLLYAELGDIIRYVGEKYRDKIGRFCITTNGTVFPKAELMELSRQYNVHYQISDYSEENPWLKEKVDKLTYELECRNISFEVNVFDWIDFDFEHMDRKEQEDEMIRIFDACHTECREIRDGKYFYCVMARAASENMGFQVGGEDYLDLISLPDDYRKILLEFDLGYSEKGYLQMCRHCAGSQRINHSLVPAGKQIESHTVGGKK